MGILLSVSPAEDVPVSSGQEGVAKEREIPWYKLEQFLQARSLPGLLSEAAQNALLVPLPHVKAVKAKIAT